jgi:hypothetical protein
VIATTRARAWNESAERLDFGRTFGNGRFQYHIWFLQKHRQYVPGTRRADGYSELEGMQLMGLHPALIAGGKAEPGGVSCGA